MASGFALPSMASPIDDIVCAPQSELAARLERTQGILRTASGFRDPEQVMELWTSPEGERWALVVAYATGLSCLVAMGEYWSASPTAPENPA